LALLETRKGLRVLDCEKSLQNVRASANSISAFVTMDDWRHRGLFILVIRMFFASEQVRRHSISRLRNMKTAPKSGPFRRCLSRLERDQSRLKTTSAVREVALVITTCPKTLSTLLTVSLAFPCAFFLAGDGLFGRSMVEPSQNAPRFGMIYGCFLQQ